MMRRTSVLLACAVAMASPSMAQTAASHPRPSCPVARMTLFGALIGFGAGAAIASPLGAPIGGNVFEDTADGGQKMWFTVGLFAVTGAVVGHVIARRRCGAHQHPSQSAPLPLSAAETEWLARRAITWLPARPVRLPPDKPGLFAGMDPGPLGAPRLLAR
jgi:hypothetical protein